MKKISRLCLAMLLLASTLHAMAGPMVEVPTKKFNRCATVRVGNSFTFEYEALVAGEATIRVQSAAGKILMTKVVAMDCGKNRLRFHVSEIPEGAYFIQIGTGNTAEVMTMIVQ